MKCPHCQTSIHGNPQTMAQNWNDADGNWGFCCQCCPECKRWIFELGHVHGNWSGSKGGDCLLQEHRILVYPKVASHSPPDLKVPKELAVDFREASLVLGDSPKASAALSRRCLQHLLRDHAGVKHGNLSSEIDETLLKLPSHLSEAVDAIRNIGNFAAHPSKSTATGEIVSVEPGEAEWLLDVLEQLFDFYFVQPARLQEKKAALNQKLGDIGKPPMK